MDSEVIDGQQRLTTISLLLAALYARINEHPDAIDEDMQLDDVRPLRNLGDDYATQLGPVPANAQFRAAAA